MPIRTQEAKTPQGERYMRAQISGDVSLVDAQQMGAQLEPGQSFSGALVLNIVEKGTEYSPDSRKYFGTMKGKYKRMATVVTNPVIRASINFMMRLTGGAVDFRLFTSEPQAIDWLEKGD